MRVSITTSVSFLHHNSMRLQLHKRINFTCFITFVLRCLEQVSCVIVCWVHHIEARTLPKRKQNNLAHPRNNSGKKWLMPIQQHIVNCESHNVIIQYMSRAAFILAFNWLSGCRFAFFHTDTILSKLLSILIQCNKPWEKKYMHLIAWLPVFTTASYNELGQS